MLLDEIKFFRRQEVKDVLAFLKLVVNPHDAASFVRVLNRFGKGIGPGTIRKISQEAYRRAGIRITDYLDEDARRTGDPFAVLLEAFEAENIVVFDVEATGVDPTRDEIIQIAGLRLGKDGKAKAEFKRLLRARRSVGDSYRVHKISDAILQQEGEEPEDVLREFCVFAEGAVIVGHNVTYDLSILGSELARLGLPPLSYQRYYDTLDIFRRFYPNLPNHKLEYLGEFCKVSHRSTHDAMDDVCATAEILTYAIEKNNPSDMWVSGGSSWRSGRMSLRSSRTASAASGMRRRGCARGNCSPRSSWTSALTRITAGAAKNSASRTCATSSARRAQWTRRRCAHSMP